MKEHLKQFKKMMESGKLGHAYLFCGADREELFDFSFEFASMLLKKDTQKSLDFYLVNKREEKEIKVEDIRNLIKFLSLSSLEDGYKVALVKDAEDMNKNASNALLKVLEEPLSGKVIILTSQNADAVLPTVLSRVQKISLFTKSQEYVMKSVKEFELFSKLISSDLPEKLNIIEKVAKDDDVVSILEGWISFFHDILYLKYGLSDFIKNKNHIEKLKNASEKYSEEKIQEILRESIKTADLIKTTNVNLRLALENLVINF